MADSIRLKQLKEFSGVDLSPESISGKLLQFNNDNGVLKINSTNSIVYDENGNVGIGTTSPSSKLEVKTGYIISSGSGSSDLGFVLDRTGLDTYHIRHVDGGLTIYNNTDDRKEMSFDGAGNVGIGTTSPSEKLTVEGNISGSGDINISGTLTAQKKSFNIPHPTQPGKRLIYGVLEGPEHGVYVRGESKSSTVTLPEEWVGLVDETTISVQLTPIGSPDIYFYEKYENNTIKVGGPQQKHYFYYIQAMRKDIEPLITVQ